MRNCRFFPKFLACLLGTCLGLSALVATAQLPDLPLPNAGGQVPGLSFSSNGDVLGQGNRVPKLEAGFTTPDADHAAQLFIVATMPSGAHTYSITQKHTPDGLGPIRTEIRLGSLPQGVTIGGFQIVGSPQIKRDNDAFPDLDLEEQAGTVKWFAPIQLAPDAKPESLKIEGKVLMQLCDHNGCVMPREFPFAAVLRPDVPAEKVASSPLPATQAAPVPPPPQPGPAGPPPAPVPGKENANPQAAAAEGEINWLPFTTSEDLRGMVGPDLNIEKVRKNVRDQISASGILSAVFWGFVGGLILNVMPCVLPVIGLKILSFVQQSGHNRGKAFLLNACYSMGLLAVFFVLALLAVLLHLGWGELFGMTWFKITLAAVVFVMALCFMGLWEVQLPAFLGGGKTGELAAHEGVVGAFFKGVLTTFLATPCSAPLLAPAVAWATSQPPLVTFTVFLSAGLGMASPYLLIGAFPELLRFLPKPGAWMETFKQLMGFVLVGTVVYLLAVLKPHYVVPTVGLLFSLSFACWLVGRIGPERDTGVKVRTWILGTVIVAVAWIVMFPGLDERVLGRFHFRGLAAATAPPDAPPVPPPPTAPTGPFVWRFGKPTTVLVGFTASWCQNCHFYENTVLCSAAVIESLRQRGIVTLKADWSDDSPEVSKMLDVLGSRQVPVVAIFSARDPNHPKVFRGSYTQAEILSALKWAEPSPRPDLASR